MPSFCPRLTVKVPGRGGEHPLPRPRAVRVRIFHCQRFGDGRTPKPFGQIPLMKLPHAFQLPLQILTEALGQNSMPVLLSFGVTDQDVVPGEVDILHPECQCFQKPSPDP